MSGTLAAMKDWVDRLTLVDTHEHVPPEAYRLAAPQDLFAWFPHYASSDLVAAGLPIPVLEEIRDPQRSAEERWAKMAPYWGATRNTAYCRALIIAARDLHGVEDINADTWRELSEKIAASRRPGWYRHVLRERANIAVSLNDTDATAAERSDPDLFAPVRRMDDIVAIRSHGELRWLERQYGVAIHSLADLEQTIGLVVERAVEQGYVALKNALAYRRPIHFAKVTRHEAETVFNRLPNYVDELRERQYPGLGLGWEEARPLQDYMVHQFIRRAAEFHLPVQVHTGLQEGDGNLLAHSHPLQITNLLAEYPEVRFDIFHAGYPWTSEVAALGKNFANAYVDLCWVHIISPAVGARVLDEWLETVPGNKILAFGGDYRIVEGAYAHSVMARAVVSKVLAAKVDEGYFSLAQAQEMAQRILYDNAWELFRLAERRRPPSQV
ncbi:MAG: amidohydrolase family protein [Chloroflexota bacterium]